MTIKGWKGNTPQMTNKEYNDKHKEKLATIQQFSTNDNQETKKEK
jgi:hypothetical protein